MKGSFKRKLISSVRLGLITVPFIVVLRIIQGGFVPGAIILGFGIGFTVGLAEFFLLSKLLHKFSFGVHLLFKSVLLMLLMWLTYALLNLIDLLVYDQSWVEYADLIFSGNTLAGLLQLLLLFSILLFFVQLDRLMGPGILMKYLIGRYYRPRKEQRIFMFLDLKGSTALADQMSPEKYFGFLQEYFRVMSDAIIESQASVYQYVGDEVVLSWSKRKGLKDNNCIKMFYSFKSTIEKMKDHFLDKYGAYPRFKAGLHGGEVITAEIGELKKDIVYNGDVLNTASRIQSICNEHNQELLISAEIFDGLQLDSSYTFESLGQIELRGKSDSMHIYSINKH